MCDIASIISVLTGDKMTITNEFRILKLGGGGGGGELYGVV